MDEVEDVGKEHWTIDQGEMVNPSADNADTVVDDQPILLPEQVQEMTEHTPQLQPPVPAPLPQTLKPGSRPHSTETHPHSGLEVLGL